MTFWMDDFQPASFFFELCRGILLKLKGETWWNVCINQKHGINYHFVKLPWVSTLGRKGDVKLLISTYLFTHAHPSIALSLTVCCSYNLPPFPTPGHASFDFFFSSLISAFEWVWVFFRRRVLPSHALLQAAEHLGLEPGACADRAVQEDKAERQPCEHMGCNNWRFLTRYPKISVHPSDVFLISKMIWLG